VSTPPPATTPWIPIWNLSGYGYRYLGAWVAGTSQPGDIRVQNNVAYLCVRPTTNAPTPWPMTPGVATYGTSLPNGPYDGQEAILVDSLTNPSYQWRFRYNAGSTSAYKWEFVGGTPRSTVVGAGETCNSGSLVDLATVGPSFTIPRNGDYLLSGSYFSQQPAAGATQYGLAETCRNGATMGSNFWLICSYYAQGAYAGSSLAPSLATGLAAGDVIKFMYRVALAGVTFTARNLTVQPVRVS